MLDSCLRVIHQYPRVDASQASLAFKQEGEVLAVGLGLDIQKPRKTLFVKKAGRKCERCGETDLQDHPPPLVAATTQASQCWCQSCAHS